MVPLILGLGAIYVLMYGSSGNTDLPPNDSLGSMEPYNEPRRPAPVAKQAEIEFAAATGVARPRQPRPIPQKDHFNDDFAKKLKAQLGSKSQVITSKSTGKLQEFRMEGDEPWIKSPNLKGPDSCVIAGVAETGSRCHELDNVMDYFHDHKPNQPGFETTVV